MTRSDSKPSMTEEIASLKRRIRELEHAESTNKNLNETLARMAREWQEVFDATNDAIWIQDHEHRVLRSNKTAERFFHRPCEELIGKRCWEIVHGTAQPIPECPLLRSQKSLQRGTLDIQEGDRWFEIIVDPMVDPEGRYAGAVHIISDITARKQMEVALQKSEDRYRLLVENANEEIMVVQDGKVKFVNHGVDWSGYSRDEYMSIPIIDTVHPEDREAVLRRYMKKIQGDRAPTQQIYRAFDKGGRIHWIEVRSVLIDWEGRAATLNMITDITDRQQALESLKDSEEKYRVLVENAGEVIVVAQRGILQFVNPETENLTGYRREELLEKPFLSFIHPEDKGMVAENHQRRMKGESVPEVYAFRVVRKDGTVRWVDIRAALISWNGEAATLNFIVDITDRKAAEEALKKSEEYFRSLIEDSSELITVMREDGTILFESSSSKRILGYEPDELVGKNALEYIHPDDLEKGVAALSPEPPGETQRSIEVRFRHKDGSWLLLEADGRDLRNHPSVKGIVINSRDITKRKQTEEELRRTLESLRKAFGTTVQVLVSAVETRDPYTAGHQIRAADLARAIATELGLSQERIDGIRMAGTIHDIGKLSVPAEILSKPTKLSELEFAIIKEHAQKGFDMLKDVESPWPLAEIVYQHHERMDGSGYPRKLKGEEIIMETRILSVADVVEAMASYRPYRPSLGIDAALNEIEKNSGTFYDNTVVDACLRLFREKGFQFEGT